MQSRTTLSAATLILATNLPGCYGTWDIEPRHVLRLDGFRSGDRVFLGSDGDTDRQFTDDSKLVIVGTDGQAVEMGFRRINILPNLILEGEERQSRRMLFVDLSHVKKVKIANPSDSLTALAVTGIVLSGGATLGTLGFLATFNGSGSSGRPLRMDDHAEPMGAPIFVDDPAPLHSLFSGPDTITRAHALAHWARELSAECASIPAFMALARDLETVSAPTNLIRAALQSAREEATHTRLCLELAHKQTSATLSTRAPEVPRANDVGHDKLLERLVVEAFWDGCLAEGTAANVAQRSAAMAKDATTRRALETIADDESRHADLARDIIQYGLSIGGRVIRNALVESIERRKASEEEELGLAAGTSDKPHLDDDYARRYGLPSTTVTNAARIETWERSMKLMELWT